MSKIYKLIINKAGIKSYTDDESELNYASFNKLLDLHEVVYNTVEQGYYSSVDIMSEMIPKVIKSLLYYNGDENLPILNIFAQVIELDNLDTGKIISYYDDYIFFNEDGSVIPKYDYKTSTPKFNIGDVILLTNDNEGYDNELETGIVQVIPGDSDNCYIVLIGNCLHDHQHPQEGFMIKHPNPNYYTVQDLGNRLKIGY